MSAAEANAAADESLRIEVVRGTTTDEELAALIAVVSEEYSSQEASATASDERTRSAWDITARSLREPLRRELGWGGFAG
jgi:hypothetical protein